MNNKSDVETRSFCNILDSHILTHHVSSGTRKGDNRLDLVISRESSPVAQKIKYKRYRCINIEAFLEPNKCVSSVEISSG